MSYTLPLNSYNYTLDSSQIDNLASEFFGECKESVEDEGYIDITFENEVYRNQFLKTINENFKKTP